MTKLIVGSTAAAFWVPTWRRPKDVDTFSDEGYDAAFGTEDQFWDDRFVTSGWLSPGTVRYATLDELYTIKRSHAYWELRNGSWDKHMADMLALEREGALFDPWLHDVLYEIWEDHYGKKRVDLSLEKDDFFADAVKRKYDHDSIHASVAYGDQPMYEHVLKDGHTVTVDMKKVKALSFDDQIKLYREEVYATALERIIIPSNYTASPLRAYSWALRRTITSLTKGWSARFLVENYGLLRRPDVDYVQRHKDQAHKLILLEEV